MRRYLPVLLAALTVLSALLALVLPQVFTVRSVQAIAAKSALASKLDIDGYVRVIDGDTVEVTPGASRLGVGLIGIIAPQVNTACGREAVAQLEVLVSDGIHLEEDPLLMFDSRDLRLYYGYTRDGRSIAEQLVALGVADPTGQGKEKDHLSALAAQSRSQRKGCTWDAGRRQPSIPPEAPANASPSPDAPQATGLPPGFVEVPVVAGLTLPTSFAFVPDGRIFISEQAGIVRVYSNGAVLPTPLLDLRAQVNNYWDRGMVSVAVDPNFETNSYIYVYYSYEPPGPPESKLPYDDIRTSRLARYTVQGNVALPSSEKLILGSVAGTLATPSCNDYPENTDCLPADGWSHMGGSIRFAPDGSLYLSTGDAASFTTINDNALRAQDIDSLAGKILRVDPATGQGLSTNPYWNNKPNATRSKVWAYGFRNPFRFNFRPGTSIPYVGDVGMDTWEDLSVGQPGRNFGWPCYEGGPQHAGYAGKQACQDLYGLGASAVQTPLLSLFHRMDPEDPLPDNRCIMGGVFYTGTTYPEQYRGAYFYGDCSTRYIDYIYVDANNKLTQGPFRFAIMPYGPTDIQMGADGSLYVLETGYGTLSRLEAGGLKAPPQGTSYISDLPWTDARNGYGPVERDESNGNLGLSDGVTITLNGVKYPKGIGVHADSYVTLYLGKTCTSFTSDFGVDDEVSQFGSVVFEVWADNTRLRQSSVMTGSSPTQNFTVDLTGKEELVLAMLEADGDPSYDHGDWAGARLTCKGVPSVSSTTPAEGAAGVLQDAAITATFDKAMDPSTLTGSNVQLFKQGASEPLTVTLSYSQATRTLNIDPASDLELSSNYTATVKGGPGGVKDTDGFTMPGDKSWSFTTNSRPIAAISQPLSGLLFKVGDVITYTGSATDFEDGVIAADDLTWEVVIHHCPDNACHAHHLPGSVGSTGSFVVPDHGDNSYFELVLSAPDSKGLVGTASVEIHPQTVQVTLASSPPGLQLVYDSYLATAPFTRTTIAGATHSLRAPSPQGNYLFDGWLHSPSAENDVSVGLSDTTYTANFVTAAPTETPTRTSTATSTSTPGASPTAIACEVQFPDVQAGSTFYSFVQCLACRGVLGGFEDGTFRPDAGITRGQLSKLVSNAAGYNESVSGQTFSDVPPDSPFYLYIERIAGRGIVGGYADGTFLPGGAATRGQIAKVLSNAAGFSDTPTGQTYIDVGTGDPFYLYVERLAARSIVGGYEDGTFRPSNPATRGQVAKMVANTFSANCQAP
ncbi:MAG TPA: NPCBM/NEW2 domain-containing protein [Chloroflexia bacterium]